jgi:hypothetical protein
MYKYILVIFITFASLSTLNAKYVQTCKVKYKQDFSWSDYYTIEVTFMSGTELNKATKSFDYDSFSTYAIVFWGDDKATIIKLTSWTSCGSEVKQNCISNSITNLAGEDKEGRGWEICTKNICF